MGDRTAARRYAKAFLDVAQEANSVDMLLRDVLAFRDAALSGNGELFRALSNPVFKLEERKAVLGQVLTRIGAHPTTSNLLRLLLDKGRFAELPLIAETYEEMADVRANRVRVTVETASPLSGELEREVRAALARATGKEVVLQTRTNPDLIGGIVARVGGKVYDASIRARLEDLKNRLIRAQAPAEA